MAAYMPCTRENNTGRPYVDPRDSSAYTPDNWQCPRFNGSGRVNVNPRPESHRGRGNRRWRRRRPQRSSNTQQANVNHRPPVNNNWCHWQNGANSGHRENNFRQPQIPFGNRNNTRASQNQHQQRNRGVNSSYETNYTQGNRRGNSNYENNNIQETRGNNSTYVQGNSGGNQDRQPTTEKIRHPAIQGTYATASLFQSAATITWRVPNVAGTNPSQRQPLFPVSGTNINLVPDVSNLKPANTIANSNPPIVYADVITLNHMLVNLSTTDTSSNPIATVSTFAPTPSSAETNVSATSTTTTTNSTTSTNFNQVVPISMANDIDANKSASASTTEDDSSHQSGTSLTTDVTSTDPSLTNSTTNATKYINSITNLTSKLTATYLQVSVEKETPTEDNSFRICSIGEGLESIAPSIAIDEKVEFRKYVDRNLPPYWVCLGEVSSNDNNVRNGNLFVHVDGRTREAITNLVASTWDGGHVKRGQDARHLKHSSIQVVSIRRIENKNLFSSYDFERKKMRLLGGPYTPVGQVQGSTGDVWTSRFLAPFMRDQLYDDINEHYLFHGTDPSLVNAIASNGLDPRISQRRNMLGTAIHFAESSTKSDQYTDRPNGRRRNNDTHTMFLVRALLGEVFRLNEDHATLKEDARRLVRPPCVVCSKDFCNCPDQLLYGSVMADGMWIFREFALYDKNLCYPEYIIEYRRV